MPPSKSPQLLVLFRYIFDRCDLLFHFKYYVANLKQRKSNSIYFSSTTIVFMVILKRFPRSGYEVNDSLSENLFKESKKRPLDTTLLKTIHALLVLSDLKL